MTDWEPIVGLGIIAMAAAMDWGLWRLHARAEERDLKRLAREAARRDAARQSRL